MNIPDLLIQITPTLPPDVNGLGDYAFNLAESLRANCGLRTKYLVTDPSWSAQHSVITKNTSIVETKSELFKLLCQSSAYGSTVLLHYVGYAYDKRGCPFWLLDSLARWKSQFPSVKLITMFHEIAASGPPWTSAFWLSGFQRKIAKQLVKISDYIVTSKQLYAEILQGYAQDRFNNVPILPVFSNIGEPSNPSDLSARQRHLVIFGGRSRRNKVYQSSLDQLHQICHYLNIQQIFDIGPNLDSIPTCIGNVPITVTGTLPRYEVSAILSGAFAGFFNYPPAFLGKSGIFAAYCAHRLLPVSAQITDHIEDGLHPGKHYLLPEQYSTGIVSETFLQEITDNAYKWYRPHCLAFQTQMFAKCIVENIAIGKEGIHET